MPHRELEPELLHRASAGERASLAQLLLIHHDALLRHIVHQSAGQPLGVMLAEDILQQTFVRAAQYIQSFQNDDTGSFLSWLKTIATNLIKDASKRRRERRATSPHASHSDGDSFLQAVERLFGDLTPPITRGRVALVMLGAAMICTSTSNVAGQQQQPFPFSDPQKMFDQFFGAAPQEDRETLDKIDIGVRDESQLGERASREYLAALRRQGTKVLTRGDDIDYLRKLVDQVHPKMEHAARYKTIRLYLADSNETDARSFPGGTLIFYRGMLDFAENEAALVGVIGHELSHLDHGHQLYDAKRMKLMQTTFTGAKGFSPDQFFRDGAMLMRSFSKPFRPEDESQADDDGATWAYELGYDPREMAKLFLRMHQRDRGEKPGLPDFLRTHPYHLDRYRALSDRFNQLQAENPKDELHIGAGR